jgi:hypothetical protein
MTSLVRSLAAVAALACLAAPAYAQVNTSANGTYGQVQLNSGFTPDPHSVTVTAGGDVDASTVSSDCVGRIARRADYSLNYRAGQLPLIISATSENDTTLAVRAPNGTWFCNDDGQDLNPVVRIESPRSGRYQIWVGTFNQDTAPAVLNISEIGAPQQTADGDGPDFSLDPTYGAADLVSGFTPDPHTQEISAGGSFDAAALGHDCVGWIARAPDYRVNWTAGSGQLPLVFSVDSKADTTLVINDSQGDWICDDDSGNGGLNPAITIANPQSGQYDVWVGTFAEGDLQQSTLNVSELYSQ